MNLSRKTVFKGGVVFFFAGIVNLVVATAAETVFYFAPWHGATILIFFYLSAVALTSGVFNLLFTHDKLLSFESLLRLENSAIFLLSIVLCLSTFPFLQQARFHSTAWYSRWYQNDLTTNVPPKDINGAALLENVSSDSVKSCYKTWRGI